jgi:hypothetical protein
LLAGEGARAIYRDSDIVVIRKEPSRANGV